MSDATPLRQLALQVALDDLAKGVREEGPNWSPRIAEYFADLDPPVILKRHQGYAWCAAAIQFWSDTAAHRFGLRNPLDGVVREALVEDYYSLAKSKGWLIGSAEADAGDLALYAFHGEGHWDHIGFVVSPPGQGSEFTAVEGNTDSHGGREGVEVALRPRDTKDYPVKFARWDERIVFELPEPTIGLAGV